MTRSMRFGLVTMEPRWLEGHLSTLDSSGFDALYVVDHPAFPAPDPWSWLAFAAAGTRRIGLGTHVTGAPFHHPTALARKVATVDVLSGGRAILGIGTGYERADFAPYGFDLLPMRERIEQLDETLCIVESLWTQEKTEFRGRHHALVGGATFDPKPLHRPHPPIVIGLNRPGRLLEVAAVRADGINTWQLGAEQVAALRDRAGEVTAAAGRRPLELGADVLLARGADAAGAESLAGLVRDTARSWGRSESATDWGRGGVLHGDADAMVEQAIRFREAGVSELSVVIGSLEEMEWFDECVVSKVD